MKQYALATIIGTGSEDRSDPFRPVIDGHPYWAITIAPDQETNTSKRWVLAVVAGTDQQLAALDASADVDVLPVGPAHLDTAWLAIGSRTQRSGHATAIRNRTGVSVTRDDPRTLREIVTALGMALDAGFNAANLDVGEAV